MRKFKIAVKAVCLLILLTACVTPSSSPLQTLMPGSTASTLAATQTATPFLPMEPTPVTPTPTPLKVFIPASAPPSLKDAVLSWGIAEADAPDSADAWIYANSEIGDGANKSTAVYALVAPFPTVTDAVSFEQVKNSWTGNPGGDFASQPLMMDASTFEAMKTLLGEPASGMTQVIPDDKLIDQAWAVRPSWAIVPFESLDPRWKVLEVDGQSPLRKEFNPSVYPLKLNFYCEGACEILPETNRDPSKLTTVIMTGTTALVRATAGKMEEHGLDYPGRDIGGILKAADILHISNEVSFADDCPTPDPNAVFLQFCSDPRYIALLEDIGTDVVEVTGNHVNDWGTQWLAKTLGMYRVRGWGYFGGGDDLSDAKKPYTTENHGNRIAFIGCNAVGPDKAWATESTPGAAPCGDYGWLVSQIDQLRKAGYIPFVSVQYNEYYQLPPSEAQAKDFKALAEQGAEAVTGTQSHFPQGFAFVGDRYIHYGPGNLFFDQMDYPVVGTRRAAIDRYSIYDGKILGVELITTMLEDWARPRLMTLDERRQFLQELFAASGW